ncbi:putative retrotransposon protein [Klebsormidium nitens]|uniref:Putative retrotransposon protein n=1 Tax=Klebsormidium nitens TaxID=105231 RepID=A0A0U9HSB6_KLENI|nr:putative retrotransposon protein [Klebsormidium nitens]|eukprot:GAQ83662.1 putative retrotransposon protein [Klebsormidium nitens]
MADSTEKIQIEKLKGAENFQTWKVLMQLLLTEKGLRKCIDPESRSSEEMAQRTNAVKAKEEEEQSKALAAIGLRVSPEYLGIITDANGSARTAWNEFQRMFQSVTNARKMMLREKLAGLRMEPGESAAKYVARAKDLKRDLIQAGLDAGDVDLAAACGLSRSFREIRMALDLQDKPISLDDMLPLFLQHEARLERDEESEQAETSNSMAFVSRNPRQHFGKSRKGSFKCWTCGEEGHRQSECSKNPDAPRNPHANKDCHRCGEKGHIERNCPKVDKGKSSDRGSSKGGKRGMKKSMAFASPPDRDLSEMWILDSGASAHLCCQKEFFSDLRPVKEGEASEIQGVGDTVKVEGIGTVALICETSEGEKTEVYLEEVRYTPEAQVNLASLSRFLAKGAKLSSEGSVVSLSMEGEEFLEAENERGVSVIRTVKRKPVAFATSQVEQARLWHRRLGHASCEALATMSRDSLVEGLPPPQAFRKAGETLCEDCVLGKQTRKPFPPSDRESSRPLELIHTDLCGTIPCKSAGGARYAVTFIDDFIRCGVVQLLQNKEQARRALEAYVNLVENQLGLKVKRIQSDRGGEYWNGEVKEFCAKTGIFHQKTNAYSSQENGVAEKLNRTLMDKVRPMLSESGLELKWWGEAILTANYVRNRTLTKKTGKTPYEMFFGKKPDISNLRVFGAPAFVHTPAQRRKKLDPVSKPSIFLGYEPGTKGYRILLTSDKRTIVVSKDVTFNERERNEGSGIWETETPQPLQTAVPPVPAEPEVPEGEKDAELRTRGRAEPEQRNGRNGRNDATELPAERSAEPEQTTEKRERRPTLGSPEAELWRKALEEEFASLQENGTWELREPPPGVKPIPCKWAFKLKKDENGNIARFKARLFIKGFKQKKGVDYEEVFAPVSRHVTLRSLLAVAAAQNLEVDQLDIKTAFLNGDLEEEIWMEQPELFETGGEKLACRLKKSLYGLKQAPRAWYLKLAAEMRELGFEPSAADPALFIRKEEDGKKAFTAVWVDDCLVVGEKDVVAHVKAALGRIFTVRDLGPVRYFLGMEVTRDREARTIKLTQKRAALDLLNQFGMEATRARRVPLNPGEKVQKQGEPLDAERYPYASLVGSLLYLANCTRPDLAQATASLARFMSSPTEDHWRLAKSVLSYLAGTVESGLTYGAEKLEFEGFCDANHGGDPDTRRSTTGYVFLLGGAAVSWASKLQQTVAYSTVEAEYMAAAHAAKEALWIRKLAADLGLESGRLTVWSDNQGALQLIKHPITSQRSKHIDISHHFVRERVIRGELKFEYCPTTKMPADFLTKALAVAKFEECKKLIGLE